MGIARGRRNPTEAPATPSAATLQEPETPDPRIFIGRMHFFSILLPGAVGPVNLGDR